MKLLARNRLDFESCIDRAYDRKNSIVLRYRNAIEFGTTAKEDLNYKEWLGKTSIQEGARIFPLLVYRGVHIYVLDETSLMSTKTLKSIDGCVSTAICKLRGYERVVFESGANTGTALTRYGKKAGLETFFFCPKDNTSLLNSQMFEPRQAHLISVNDLGSVKKAALLFGNTNRLKRIPETTWRYHASMFRGLFLLEHMFFKQHFDWVSQTVSAAFGPIGIYSVLESFEKELESIPRFLGLQQEANCPMYKAWKSNKTTIGEEEITSTTNLLTRVMYDATPQTYGTFQDLRKLLAVTGGALATVNHSEFDHFLEHDIDGAPVLSQLADNGIEITLKNGEIIEKTGLIALAGTLKEIDSGTIEKGSTVLCCLTSGISEADGKSVPEFRVADVDSDTKKYSQLIWGSL